MNGHVKLASDYVTSRWMPLLPDTLGLLRSSVPSAPPPKSVIADFGFYSAVISRAAARGASTLSDFTKIFSESGTLLSFLKPEITTFTIQGSKPEQLKTLQRALIASTVVSACAPTLEVDPDYARLAAAVRSTGLALLAWNYPQILSRSMERAGPHMTVDEAITEKLGFTPTMLVQALAKLWKLPQEVQSICGASGVVTSKSEPWVAVASKVRKLCTLGELVAAHNAPLPNENVQAPWESTWDDLLSTLGKKGATTLLEQLHAQSEPYLRANSAFQFELSLFEKSASDLKRTISISRASSNPYLRQCTPEVREALNAWYETAQPGVASKGSLDHLFTKVAPTAGFIAGAMYLSDAESNSLQPITAFGALTIRQLNPCRISNHGGSFIARAFLDLGHSIGPEILTERTHCYGARIGSEQRLGVLYLVSLDEQSSEALDQRALTIHARALAAALSDVFSVF